MRIKPAAAAADDTNHCFGLADCPAAYDMAAFSSGIQEKQSTRWSALSGYLLLLLCEVIHCPVSHHEQGCQFALG